MIKAKLQYWAYRLLGYPEDIQSLLNGIDMIDSEEVAMYPKGEFHLAMATPDGDHQPVIFPTPQERAAFSAGIQHGVSIMGGTVGFMNEEEKNLIQSEHAQERRRKMN